MDAWYQGGEKSVLNPFQKKAVLNPDIQYLISIKSEY
jgi:hypothetical protein